MLKPGLDPFRQGSKVRDSLHLVIWQLYVEVLLKSSQQTERLQAVDTKLFEEVIVWREALPRDLELHSSQIQDFIQRLLLCLHISHYYGR